RAGGRRARTRRIGNPCVACIGSCRTEPTRCPMNRAAVVYALAAAALFGMSTPAAKALLGTVHPAVLAGLLYCGAGIGIAVLRRVRVALPLRAAAAETALGRADIPWLAAAIVAGGVAGPLLAMAGLARTPAATASLLLSIEGAAT